MEALKKKAGELAHVLGKFKQIFLSIGMFSAIINLMMLVPSLYMLQVYDRVLTSRNQTTLIMLTAMLLGAYLLISALELVRSYLLIRVGARLDMELNKRIFVASFEQQLRQTGANAGQALHDLSTVRQFITGNGLFAFFDAPWFPVYLLVIFLFSPQLGIFALVGTAILVALAIANELASRKPLKEASTLSVSSGALANNSLRNAEVIEAMGMMPNMMRKWFAQHSNYIFLQAQASERAGVISAVTRFVRLSMQSLILGYAAVLTLDGKITPGMMIVASILMGRTLAPVEQLIGVWRTWAGARSAYERLNDLLTQHPARVTGMRLPNPQGVVALEGVTVVPPLGSEPVIRNLSLKIVPGDVLGVIGPSGAGKSSLARIIVGVWPAATGCVRIDGADIQSWNKEELGPSIGYLPQDIELFSGTVSENIARFGDVDPEQIVLAAQRAGVHDMILQMPKGYDTVLGVGGSGLAGGQKQRIGLARALYGDPALIVLDEPNSNLDEVGEKALVSAIAEMNLRGKTIVMITHRPSIIGVTNKLLVLRDGVGELYGATSTVLAELTKLNAQANQASQDRIKNSNASSAGNVQQIGDKA
jgi:ATP-binding cassette, subfamily C, bacterial exporter for protease/lipase